MHFILPTAEIIDQYRKFEPLLSFYREGIKGIIRDIILMENGSTKFQHFAIRRNKKVMLAETIVERIMRKYNDSPEAMFQSYFGNDQRAFCVELAAELLYTSVNEMMDSLFGCEEIDVDESTHRWIGNDIIVTIRKGDTNANTKFTHIGLF